MKQIYIDIEANGLLEEATQIWCICACVVDNDRATNLEWVNDWYAGRVSKPKLSQFTTDFYSISEGAEIVGHNIIWYDIPMLQKHLRVDFSKCKIVDTLVISRVLDPDRLNGHSIQAWAQRLGGEQKVGQEQWSVFEENMVVRCESDVRLTRKVMQSLEKEIVCRSHNIK